MCEYKNGLTVAILPIEWLANWSKANNFKVHLQKLSNEPTSLPITVLGKCNPAIDSLALCLACTPVSKFFSDKHLF